MTCAPFVQRAVITVLEKGIPHRRTLIDLAHKPDWFRQISPLGKVPLLKVNDQVLFESAVICEYLDEITPGSLLPTDPLQKAHHRAWIEFGSSILTTIAEFYNAPDEDRFEQKRLEMIHKLSWVEQSLTLSPYFQGAEFSLVDAVYGPIFRYFECFDSIGEFEIFSETHRVRLWRQSLLSRPSVQQAVGADYPHRLRAFLQRRSSCLSSLMRP